MTKSMCKLINTHWVTGISSKHEQSNSIYGSELNYNQRKKLICLPKLIKF